MDYNLEKNTVTIFGKTEKLNTLANRLASLSGEQVYSLFSNRGIAVPRRINCMALTSVINGRLKTLHASELSKDYFQRLSYYKNFSETHLYNLFKAICDTKEYFKEYRTNLFKLIIINFVGLNLNDGEIQYLKNLRKLHVESFDDYFHYISSMCQEQDGTFDGQDFEVLKDFLVKASSSQEIITLANKYGIEMASSLKKFELIEYIKYYLEENGQLTKTIESELTNETVTGLNKFCKSKNIPMSSNMTKTELVTYLFYILSQCEIVTTSVRRIETLSIFEPLDFTVDMSCIKGFFRDDSRRIIRYDGDENEFFPELEPSEDSLFTDELSESNEIGFVQMESIDNVQEQGIEEKVETPAESPVETAPTMVEESPVETAPTMVEEKDILADVTEEPSQYVENSDEVKSLVEEKNESSTETSVKESNVISKMEIPEEILQADPIKANLKNLINNDKTTLSMTDVRENKEFGNEKILNHAKSSVNRIVLPIIGVVLLVAFGFCVWWFFIR